MGDVAAQGRGAATRQVAQGLALGGGQQPAVLGPEGGAVGPDHVAHFHSRPVGDGDGHGRPSVAAAAAGTAKRSSRLGVWCRRRVLTCR